MPETDHTRGIVMAKYIALTFDDAVANQLSVVVPLLKQYGFGATFFICRRAQWLAEHPELYLDWREIRAICDAGFEIGNHTMNHLSLREAADDEGRREVELLGRELAAHGIPAPESFAYPGGPYAERAAKWLEEYNLSCARTTEKTLWLRSTDPMNVGSYAVSADEEDNFRLALSDLAASRDEPCAAVLTYHGVPDIAHPWCSTPPEMFRKHLDALRDLGLPVLSMRECRRRIIGR